MYDCYRYLKTLKYLHHLIERGDNEEALAFLALEIEIIRLIIQANN